MTADPAQELTPGGPPRRPASTTAVRVTAVDGGQSRRRRDQVATEEPLEVRLQEPGEEQRSVVVTMRTPGSDFELAAGFLFTEGVIDGPGDVRTIRYCTVPREEQHYNVVSVDVTRRLPGFEPGRNFYSTSSCGVCGKASLDQIEVRCAPVAEGPVVAAAALTGMPDTLRESQRVFESTGGLHAAALFSPEGELLASREDVGRHNAVDKLIGSELLAGNVPLSGRVLLVSGRSSFEIVQKAAVAGIPVVCAVSAPSSLAVDAAKRFGMTLVGFLRGDRFNVYTGPERIRG